MKHKFTRGILLPMALLCWAGCFAPASAQTTANPGLNALGSLFSIGGYFFTNSSASNAMGSPKFYSEASYFGHSASLGAINIAGGIQIVSASDHFFPFTGGTRFSLYGPALRLSTPHLTHRAVLFVTAGVYAASISTKSGVNTTTFAPSAEFGINLPLIRYITLTAGYRIAPSIDHIDSSGFSVGLKLF